MGKFGILLMGLLGSSSLVYANCEIDSDLLNRSCSNEYYSPKNIKHLNEYLQYGKFKDGKLLNLELDFDIKDKEINIATWCDIKVNRGVSFKSSLNGICIKGANIILKGENQLNSDKKSPIIIGALRNKLEEPLVIGFLYPIQWCESRVNLAELAKLRYIEGWSRQKLADHYQRTLYAITNYCQNIRKKDFDLEGLTIVEKEQIRWAYKN